jgi:nucleoside-diphosphate-sugar epimerase
MTKWLAITKSVLNYHWLQYCERKNKILVTGAEGFIGFHLTEGFVRDGYTARFVPITEDHPLQGQSPYSASKIGADQIAMSSCTSAPIRRPWWTHARRH